MVLCPVHAPTESALVPPPGREPAGLTTEADKLEGMWLWWGPVGKQGEGLGEGTFKA